MMSVMGDQSCSSAEFYISSETKQDRRSTHPHRGLSSIPTEDPCRCRVRFNEDILVRRTFNRDDISDEIASAYWYTKKESKAFKSAKDDCARGLEYKHPVTGRRRLHNKETGRIAVFLEQERQRRCGESNDVLLSKAYVTAIIHCRRSALIVGLKDEQAVFGQAKRLVFGNEEEERPRPMVAPQKGARSLFEQPVTHRRLCEQTNKLTL
jgi:hypothetical protein